MSKYENYKEYHKQYYQRNKKKRDEQSRKWALENKEKSKLIKDRWKERNPQYEKEHRCNNIDKILQREKKYRENNKEKIKERDRLYFQNNKDKIYKHRREKYNNDINFKLASVLRRRLRGALRGGYKAGSAVTDLGCSIECLKIHLESQFQADMSWDNYGPTGWHIDHIKPLISFNLENREQLLEACHYTNLQPLWAEENFSKGGVE